MNPSALNKLDVVRNPAESGACERCGSFDVLEMAGLFLCADCAALAGCGCAGHGEQGTRVAAGITHHTTSNPVGE